MAIQQKKLGKPQCLTAYRLIHYHEIIIFNPFPNKPLFLRVCITSLLKTQWESARNGQLLLFPVFSTHLENFLPFWSN